MRLEAPVGVPDQFRDAVVLARPDLGDAAFSVAGRGWHSLAVDVGGRLIAKFPEGREAEAALRREARILAAVRPHLGMPVPDMTLFEGPPLFSLHPLLAGDVLERNAYRRFADAERDRLAQDLAGFFADLHMMDPAAAEAAGAEAAGIWDTDEATLAPIWQTLPSDAKAQAMNAVAAYRDLAPDPYGAVYGFFDAHGWNMAFDQGAGRLNGIFDFADSGFGPVHREFVPVSFIDPDLTVRAMRAYGEITGRRIDANRVHLLTSAMLASELAGAMEIGINEAAVRQSLVDWITGRDAFVSGAERG